MRGMALCVLALAMLLVLALVPSSVTAGWIPNGAPVCTTSDTQRYPEIASDGAGGAVIVWNDLRSSSRMYAQRVDATGLRLWTKDGVLISQTGVLQGTDRALIASDGEGGAFIAWPDYRSGTYTQIYVQRLDAQGARLYNPDGRQIEFGSTPPWHYLQDVSEDGSGGAIVIWRDGNGLLRGQRITHSDQLPWGYVVTLGGGSSAQACPDGQGGAIVTWIGSGSGGTDIFAQRIGPTGSLLWTGGVGVCSATGYQGWPQVVADEAGGAIVVWADQRSGGYDIYVQKVSADGTPLWTTNGVALCDLPGDQTLPQVVSDGLGGAIVTWDDARAGDRDIYAQRIDASGTIRWAEDGVPLATGTMTQNMPQFVSDGAGGAIVAWTDNRTGNSDISAQRVDASGTVMWTPNGVAICTAASSQYDIRIASAEAGGALLTWSDWRNSSTDVYAQLIDIDGHPGGYYPPTIASVRDVPGDQGGWVRLSIDKSVLDSASEPDMPVAAYNVWERVSASAKPGELTGGSGMSPSQVEVPGGLHSRLHRPATCL